MKAETIEQYIEQYIKSRLEFCSEKPSQRLLNQWRMDAIVRAIKEYPEIVTLAALHEVRSTPNWNIVLPGEYVEACLIEEDEAAGTLKKLTRSATLHVAVNKFHPTANEWITAQRQKKYSVEPRAEWDWFGGWKLD